MSGIAVSLGFCAALVGADYGSGYWPVKRGPGVVEVGPGPARIGQAPAALLKTGVCSAEDKLLEPHKRTRRVVRVLEVVATGVVVGHNIQVNKDAWKRVQPK